LEKRISISEAGGKTGVLEDIRDRLTRIGG
jgi:hypothetical protein